MEAYPLQWPQGRPRVQDPKPSKFTSAAVAKSRRLLMREMKLLRATDVVITSNMVLNRDGTPAYRQPNLADTGVAVYFKLNGQQRVISSDKYIRVEDNLHAAALTIEALRSVERWGTGRDVQAAFEGFKTLPSGEKKTWQEILGLSYLPGPIDEQDVRNAYKRLAREHHPDVGGDQNKFAEILAAYQEGLKAVRGHDV